MVESDHRRSHQPLSHQPWLSHYDAGVPATLAPYPQRTLLDYLSDAAHRWPTHIALTFKGSAMTYAALEESSDRLAAALAHIGVREGDRIALLLPNCPQFFIAELAAWKL